MAVSDSFPTHAYVPGATDRHAEGAFDHIRNTAHADMTPQELAASEAFRVGLSYLETGLFWEAHEVLEPVWMALPDHSDERHLVQALIQLANAQLKVKMKRPKAAARLCGITRGLLFKISQDSVMGLDVGVIVTTVDSLEQSLRDVI